jgi:hypothetical protein
MLTKKDLDDLQERGIPQTEIEKQLQYFREGFPFLPIARPATPGDGILRPKSETEEDFIKLYESKLGEESILKFVPASGAATRMFKDLYSFLGGNRSDQVRKSVGDFISGLDRFAFYRELMSCSEKRGVTTDSPGTDDDHMKVIKCLLDKDGMNYGNSPKGLLAFHRYGGDFRTAFEEHLVEGALYCRGNNNLVRIHLTVSPEHRQAFEEMFRQIEGKYEEQYGTRFEVDFSVQKSSTDTIAVDSDNRPFRDEDGRLVFRPGGHGSLLENLDELEAGLIFIKNIDNVVPDHFRDDTIRYKKVLGGIMISFRERIMDYMRVIRSSRNNHRGLVEEIMTFLEDELCLVPPWGHDQWDTEARRRYIISKLDRPLRICGMVKNVGEPGGGPFWVKNRDGSVSLQIVESTQINLSNPLMKKLFNASTHFNPVDLVCSVTDFHGRKYDLHRFRDPGTGFISSKSVGGKELKALELPGLWNGSMADWNTVFVEVPISTFNPVKTVNDLLRPEHG